MGPQQQRQLRLSGGGLCGVTLIAGAGAPAFSPRKNSEIWFIKGTKVTENSEEQFPNYRKESYYDKMLHKIIHLRKDWEIYLGHAPKHEKYCLCQRIRNRMDDIFELCIECKARYWNKTTLTKLDVTVAKIRGDAMLYYQLGLFEYHNNRLPEPETDSKFESRALRRYRNINVQVDTIGRMVGGIIKANAAGKADELANSKPDNQE